MTSCEGRERERERRRDEGGVSAFLRGKEGVRRTYCLALSLDFEVIGHYIVSPVRVSCGP